MKKAPKRPKDKHVQQAAVGVPKRQQGIINSIPVNVTNEP